MFPSKRINNFQQVLHDVVTVAYMNMNAVFKNGSRPLGPKARYTRAESDSRTLCRSGVKLVWHHALSYGYARVHLRASRSKVI